MTSYEHNQGLAYHKMKTNVESRELEMIVFGLISFAKQFRISTKELENFLQPFHHKMATQASCQSGRAEICSEDPFITTKKSKKK